MTASFGLFDSRRAENGCKALLAFRASQQLRLIERRQRRAERRAHGVVIRPEPVAPGFSEHNPDLRDVRLRGYDALQLIFPDASKETLIHALLATQDLPCSMRAAAASTNLLTSGKSQMPLLPTLSRPRSASPVARDKGHHILTGPLAPPLLRAVTQPVHDSPEAHLGLFGAYAASVLSIDVLDPHPSRKDSHASRPAHAASKSVGDERNSTQSAWRRCKTQDWQDEAFPTCSERNRKKGRTTNGWKLRKHRRSYVDSCLLHAKPPSQEVLTALEKAESVAATVAQAEAEAEAEAETGLEDSFCPWKSWDILQRMFLDEHEQSIRNELGEAVQISPVHPQSRVKEEFLSSCGFVASMPVPAYHGTKAKNIMSISSRGLLLPGHGGVTVANGSAHGVGIYTAKLGCSSLSKGFCDSDKIFICGVCDGQEDEVAKQELEGVRLSKWTHGLSLHHRQHRVPQQNQTASQQMLGNFRVHRDTGSVKHVGSAMVVFNETRVAPLFLASGVGREVFTWLASRLRIVELWPHGVPGNANHRRRSQWVGRQRTLIKDTQEVVWLPPQAVGDRDQVRTKRRFEGKRKHLRRRQDRKEKFAVTEPSLAVL